MMDGEFHEPFEQLKICGAAEEYGRQDYNREEFPECRVSIRGDDYYPRH